MRQQPEGCALGGEGDEAAGMKGRQGSYSSALHGEDGYLGRNKKGHSLIQVF